MILQAFEKYKYLNLETFRKSGVGVKTPVWFVREEENLYVWTQRQTGKAKRVRHNGKVNIAPSTGSGKVLGEWVAAYAVADETPSVVNHVTELLIKKYGMVFHIFNFLARLHGPAVYTILKIQATPPTVK